MVEVISGSRCPITSELWKLPNRDVREHNVYARIDL